MLRFPLEALVPSPGSSQDRPLRWWLGLGPTPPSTAETTPGRRGAVTGRAAAGLAVAASVAAILVVAGIPARSGASAGGNGPVVGRPSVKVSSAALASVSVSSDARTLDASISERHRRAIARDVLADLIITGRAERRRDPRLAASAGTGAWLAQVNLKIQLARQTGRIAVDSYSFDRIGIVVVRTRYWAAPQLGTQTRGTVEQVTDDLAGRGGVLARTTSSEHRTFVVVDRGGDYLITADDVP